MFDSGILSSLLILTATIYQFVLIVCYGWTDTKLNASVPWILGCITLVSIIYAVIPWSLGYYNYSPSSCWIESFPYSCGGDPNADEYIPCVRGEYAHVLASIWWAVPGFPCLVGCLTGYIKMFRAVRNVEDRISRYAGSIRHARASSSLSQGNANTGAHGSSDTFSVLEDPDVRTTNREGSSAVATKGG